MNGSQRNAGQRSNNVQHEHNDEKNSINSSMVKYEEACESYDSEVPSEYVYQLEESGDGRKNYQLQRYVPQAIPEDHPHLVAARVQAKLQQKLGPEYVSYRPGQGGKKVAYIESHKTIELSNEIFGFDGWSSKILSRDTVVDEKRSDGKYNVSICVTTNVTLRNGAFHEDVGYGNAEGFPSRGQAFEKAGKEAATDSLKRTLRLFGNALGNSVYDKTHTANVSKMKASVPSFDAQNLVRGPGANVGSSTCITTNGSGPSRSTMDPPAQNQPQHTAQRASIVTSPKAVVSTSMQSLPQVRARPATISAGEETDIELARQERLKKANAKQEELRLRKEKEAKNVSASGASSAGSLTSQSTIDSPTKQTLKPLDANQNSSLNGQQRHLDFSDEFANDLEDVSSSQLMALSQQASGKKNTPSSLEQDSNLIENITSTTSIKLSPSFEAKAPVFLRGGAVESGKRANDLEGNSANSPQKRLRQ